MHARSHVNIHADVQVRKLRVHQRVHQAGSRRRSYADARLKAPRGNRTRSPMRSFVCSPSVMRTSGSCKMRVDVSVKTAFTAAPGSVTL